MSERLAMVQRLVAQPVPSSDPEPSWIGNSIFVGNKHHAADVAQLCRLGVTAVMNCAPSGIRGLPINDYRERSISYSFTNVAQDAHTYPILHTSPEGAHSEHLEAADAFYQSVLSSGGKAMFFCVAGQNRSAALAVAVQLLHGTSLEEVLQICHRTRPFMLENVGFQRQLIELETAQSGQVHPASSMKLARPKPLLATSSGPFSARSEAVVELLVPGLRAFNVAVKAESTIEELRATLTARVNEHIASDEGATSGSSQGGGDLVVGKAWLVLTCFGVGPELGLLLEEAVVEEAVLFSHLRNAFHLETAEVGGCVRWNSSCRFELIVFSLESATREHVPFSFRHQEREGAPGTLLAESIIEPHLRAWDFVTGEAYRSKTPMVFSYADDSRSKRDFMNISTSRHGERQQFSAPGEGGILGMGNNAIVHRVDLVLAKPTGPGASPGVSSANNSVSSTRSAMSMMGRAMSFDSLLGAEAEQRWDAAVKRAFSLNKMLAAMESKAEAGVAKRLRLAGALNRHGRLLYFYGLGIALASNIEDHDVYHFEITLLSQYQSDFSSYTLKKFMDEYTALVPEAGEAGSESERTRTLQDQFTILKVKILLVSLLNAFRDLTLMGVQAFDFNHLNNVLISRDYKNARLIDIDGASKGSIQFPSRYIGGDASEEPRSDDPHKPALDVDLCTLLPEVVQQLLFGKGRGKPFVNQKVSEVRRAKSDDEAKALIKQVLQENFFTAVFDDAKGASGTHSGGTRDSTLMARMPTRDVANKHLHKVVEWLHAVLLRRSPWKTWTNDVYDAIRCIDHLPIA